MNETYYDKDGIRVRQSVASDVEYLKDHLKESDVNEIYASHHSTPEQALKIGLEQSIFCLTIENGKPIGVFGITAENLLGNKGVIWLLTTDDLKMIKIRFIRHCKEFIKMFLDFYPYLDNYVHIDNKQTILWLKYLGATLEEPIKYGIEGELFHHFYFDKYNN